MDVLVSFLAAFFATYIEVVCPNCFSSEGPNILLNKPSKQKRAYYGKYSEYGSQFGNDGDVSTMIGTALVDEPYWQGDLQGNYMVSSITLTSSSAGGFWNDHLRNAFIGVSALDMTCPGSDVIICGQWPILISSNLRNASIGVSVCPGSDVIICGQWPNEILTSATRTLSCSLFHPVRFVKVWKVDRGHLGFSEVKAAGKKTGMEFVPIESNKLVTTTRSLTVTLAAECSSTCFNTPRCIAFSFRKGGQLNCLLATDSSTTNDDDWATYKIKHC